MQSDQHGHRVGIEALDHNLEWKRWKWICHRSLYHEFLIYLDHGREKGWKALFLIGSDYAQCVLEWGLCPFVYDAPIFFLDA